MTDSAAHPPAFSDAPRLAAALRAAILRAADPSDALERAWPHADLTHPIRLLAIGKAAIPMARRALTLLPTSPAALILTTPHPEAPLRGVETLTADHPLPTERNLAAAARVESFLRAAAPDETILVLLSGGGSALLTSPAEGLTLDDLRHTTSALLRAGATIRQLNAVRKHCERLKGGRLARLIAADHPHAEPPRTLCLIVSDVLGDPLDAISSGPLSPDPTTYADALHALRSLPLTHSPQIERITAHLTRGLHNAIPETPKPGDPLFARISPRIIAGNQHTALAARDALLALGFQRTKLVCRVEGEAADVARALTADAASHNHEAPTHHAATAVIYAGETTVTVGDSPGRGGRNQELALAAALHMPELLRAAHAHTRMAVLTLATDGIDGPTDAAGALVTSDTAALARTRNLDLPAALARHDSHTALDALGCLVRTGPTGANVNDIAVAMAWSAAPPAGPTPAPPYHPT